MDLAVQVNDMTFKEFQQALENALAVMNDVEKQLINAGYENAKMSLDIETSVNTLGDIETSQEVFEFNCFTDGLVERYALAFNRFLDLNQNTYNLLVDEITDYFVDEYCYGL